MFDKPCEVSNNNGTKTFGGLLYEEQDGRGHVSETAQMQNCMQESCFLSSILECPSESRTWTGNIKQNDSQSSESHSKVQSSKILFKLITKPLSDYVKFIHTHFFVRVRKTSCVDHQFISQEYVNDPVKKDSSGQSLIYRNVFTTLKSRNTRDSPSVSTQETFSPSLFLQYAKSNQSDSISVTPLQKKPVTCWKRNRLLWILFILILSLLLMSLTYLLLIPVILQKQLDSTFIETKHVQMTTSSEPMQLLLDVVINTDKPNIKALLKPSTINLYHIPEDLVIRRLVASYENKQKLHNLRLTETIDSIPKRRLGPLLCAYSDSELCLEDKSIGEWLNQEKTRNLEIFWREEWRTFEDAHKFGSFLMPESYVQGTKSYHQYSTILDIQNKDLLQAMLKEYIERTTTRCFIQANVDLKIWGLTFRNLLATKVVLFNKLQLAMDKKDLKRIHQHLDDPDYTPPMHNINLKKIALNRLYSANEEVSIEIELDIDLGNKKADRALIPTIDSIGYIMLEQHYKGYPIFSAQSHLPVALKAGVNPLKLNGFIPKFDRIEAEEHRNVFIDLFQSLLSLKTVCFESHGLGSSLSLFDEAVKAVNFAFILKPIEELQFVKSVSILGMKLLPDKKSTELLTLVGDINLTLMNPFMNAPIFIDVINISGDLELNSSNTFINIGKLSGNLYGDGKPTERNQVAIVRNSIMDSVEHSVSMRYEFRIQFSSYKELIENYPEESKGLVVSDPETASSANFLTRHLVEGDIIYLNLNDTKFDAVIEEFPLGSNIKFLDMKMQNQPITLSGFNKFHGLKIIGVSFKKVVNESMSSDGPNAVELKIEVYLPSGSFELDLGYLTVEFLYQGQHVTDIKSAQKCQLQSGGSHVLFHTILDSTNPYTVSLMRAVILGTNPSVRIRLKSIKDSSLPDSVIDAVLGIELPVSLNQIKLNQSI